jgi:broad specificity phosphatase PhoE
MGSQTRVRGERWSVGLLIAAFGLTFWGPAPPTLAAQLEARGADSPAPVVVFLVRHAERADDDPRDPGLTTAGVARADALARMLADVGLTHIWSTDYRRTRGTAGPVASAVGLEVALYDPGAADAMEAFANRLRAAPGRHLVVGHSNTTPALVQALGGDPLGEIAEDEYDRLYVLVFAPDGTVTSTLLRFGGHGVGAGLGAGDARPER